MNPTMQTFLFHLYGISLIVCIGSVSGPMSRQLTSRVVDEFDGKSMSKFSRKITYDTSLSYCHIHCLEDDECMSFFYHRGNKTCQTHGVVFFNSDDGDLSPGTKHYRSIQDFCPSSLGYIYNRALKFCYKAHYSAMMAYNSARQVCQSEGGDLIIIDTEAKRRHITQTISGSTFPNVQLFLIGARGGAVEGDWRWVDGRQVDPGLWCPFAANRGGIDDWETAFFRIPLDEIGCMNEVPEYYKFPFFCELNV